MMILYVGGWGVFYAPQQPSTRGILESEVELATNREKKQRLKTFRCIIRKYWMVDKKCFFLWTFLLKVVCGGSETWTKPDFFVTPYYDVYMAYLAILCKYIFKLNVICIQINFQTQILNKDNCAQKLDIYKRSI